MTRRDIVIGLIILVLLAGVIFYRQRKSTSQEDLRVPETLSSVQENIEKKFNLQIPEDVDKAELKDVSGAGSSAIATRKFENGKFTASILADLPDTSSGSFYQAWLVKSEEGKDDSFISLGRVELAKGGWMLNFQGTEDLSDYSKVLVTSEKVQDSTPETRILEGSF